MHEVGLRPIIGLEVELLDPVVPDAAGRGPCLAGGGKKTAPTKTADLPTGQLLPDQPIPDKPRRPLLERQRPPGHRDPRREDLRGVRTRELGPHLVLIARDMTGYRSLCRLVSAANLAGTKGVPRFRHVAAGAAH